MTVMYRLADDRGITLGVFDAPEEAMGFIPEVNGDWRPIDGGWDGWRPDGSYFDTRPHFTIRMAGDH